MSDYDAVNRALVQLYREGSKEAAGKLFTLNVKAIGKVFNKRFDKDWLDAESYLQLIACLRTYKLESNIKFVTYWINRCKFTLPEQWDREIHLIRLPQRMIHTIRKDYTCDYVSEHIMELADLNDEGQDCSQWEE